MENLNAGDRATADAVALMLAARNDDLSGIAVLIADKTLEELRLLAFFLSRYAPTMTAETDAVLQHDSTTA